MTETELYSTKWAIIAIALRITLPILGLSMLCLSVDLINVAVFAIIGLVYLYVIFFSRYRGPWVRELECD